MNSQLTIDFSAISHSLFHYRNQFGEIVRIKPRQPTVHGGQKIPDGKCFGEDGLVSERVKRLGYVDEWTPVCILQFRNNHSLTFTGQKAVDMNKNYKAHIYGRK